MTPLVFVYLARDAGSTFADLARDIARAARPGDHVLVLDDSGSADTAPRIGRFLAEEGWPAGVTGDSIVTGARGAGDPGVAVNLALAAIAVPGAAPDPARVLFLAAGSRLDADALAAARRQADAGGHDLVLLPWAQWSLDHGRPLPAPEAAAWPALPGEAPAARALRLAPPLQGLMADRRLLAGLRAAEGRESHGDLALVWQVLRAAARPLVTEALAGHRPHPADPGPALFHAAAALAGAGPAARNWCADHLPLWLTGLTPGARGAVLTACAGQKQSLSAGTGSDLLALFLRGDSRALAAALPRAHPAPPAAGRARLHIHLAGRHAARGLMPFAWPALAPLWSDHAARIDRPEGADLILWAHPRDPEADDGAAAGSPAVQALFSEEPFWDTIPGPDPLARRIAVPGPRGATLFLHQVNHHRSPVFAFDRIPYFLLTRPVYAARYAAIFARNARLSPADWGTALAAASPAPVFMAERRPEPFHDIRRPEGDLIGLCAWRTRLAEALPGANRIGSFGGNDADWHQDKLDLLDGKVRILSALENTHQPDYISEKLFDAFACGARPLYMASPGHRLHDLGLPERSFVNLWGLTSEAAAAVVAGLDDPARWDAGFLQAYAGAQRRLAALWTDPGAIAAERARLGRALVAELHRLAGFAA